MQIMTNSRLRAFSRCRRLHHLRYERLRRAIVNARPLAVGSLLHAALEAWWTWHLPREAGGRRFPTPLDAAIAAIAERVALNLPGDGEVSPFDLAAADALVCGYDARWGNDAIDEWEVIGVEAPFATEIVNPDTGRKSQLYGFAGKIDVVLRRLRDGAEGFMEHKSTTSDLAPSSTYWRRLRMDPQVSDYFIGAASIGLDPRFCVYDVIGKPQLKPLKATPEEDRKYTKPTKKEPFSRLYANQRERDETPEEFRERVFADIEADPNGYYSRAEVVRLDEDLRERRFDVWQTVKSLHETKVAGRHARNTDACFDFNRPCDYFDVCSRVARIDDDLLFRTVADAHEELIPPPSILADEYDFSAGSTMHKAALAKIRSWSKDRDSD